jgi:methylated-DNA-protein-cysteine methyltransferase-like protein
MAFASPPNPLAFALRVYALVRRIPRGRLMAYGQIAKALERPKGVAARTYAGLGPRWVGAAMARAPEGVPWQRVINSQGRISPRPGAGAQDQQQLLEAEGVPFSPTGRVDLRRYAWHPPTARKKSATRGR